MEDIELLKQLHRRSLEEFEQILAQGGELENAIITGDFPASTPCIDSQPYLRRSDR